MCACSKNNRSIDTPVKGPPQGPRLHIDIPRVQLLIEDKEGIKQIGTLLHFTTRQTSIYLRDFLVVHLFSGINIIFCNPLPATGEDKAAVPVTDTEFSQSVNPQNFCTGVSLHHQALIQNSGPLIDMSDIRPGTSAYEKL